MSELKKPVPPITAPVSVPQAPELAKAEEGELSEEQLATLAGGTLTITAGNISPLTISGKNIPPK